jgi:hypothetical protein
MIKPIRTDQRTPGMFVHGLDSRRFASKRLGVAGPRRQL